MRRIGACFGLVLGLGVVQPTPQATAGARDRAPVPTEDRPMVGHQPLSCDGAVCVDARLRAALELLAASATRLDARPSGPAVRAALGHAGYPGDARVTVTRAGEAFPLELRAGEPADMPRDIAWASRRFYPLGGSEDGGSGDGGSGAAPTATTWWIYAWAPKNLTLEPVFRDLEAGESVSVLVTGPGPLQLLLAPPRGPVEVLSLSPGRPRVLNQLRLPGEHRLEILRDDAVELVFSVWVDQTAPVPGPLPSGSPDRSSPDRSSLETRTEVIAGLSARARELRANAGLPALQPYADFVPLAEAQARCLIGLGRLDHDSERCPSVARRAKANFFPLAHISENLAQGPTLDELWDALYASPGHRANLLCESCTHDSLAVVPDPGGGLWVVWEFLSFPAGFPRPNVRAP